MKKNVKVAYVFGLAVAAMMLAPLQAAKAPKASIIHKGKRISVSCNALDGHLQHSQERTRLAAVERRSIRVAQIRQCR